MNEVFLDIPNYEGLYQVSNLGRVRRNGKILRPFKNEKGYLRIDLYKNGTKRTARVHRLVAHSFIPNPQNLPEINHKDEDKTNNAVGNLEWCDAQYNNNYGTRTKRSAESHQKPILQFDKKGNFIAEYKSTIEASNKLNISQGNICNCCSGIRKSAGGYIWKYKN
ncbi:NUMOD4 domain-containing protein [Ruminococcus sp.]|uniref:NUMOD4 domain-containing protein n=1 Tax=Ruminococcus sp. TaxID=41978 RepID=UPI002E8240A7|nr:NUMOD4 domain-containing protein [Ruminococcus sp.]MEE3439923.1 NUMOD4 domain-containing protein [Ruminococcus sp.]